MMLRDSILGGGKQQRGNEQRLGFQCFGPCGFEKTGLSGMDVDYVEGQRFVVTLLLSSDSVKFVSRSLRPGSAKYSMSYHSLLWNLNFVTT